MPQDAELPKQNAAELPSQKRRWKTLVALGFGYLIDKGEDQALGILFPAILAQWGLRRADLGLIGTTRKSMAALSSPFWGYVADRWNRKLVLFIGTGIWGIWTLLCGLVPSFGHLLLIRTISGIGLGCLMPATFSLISDLFPPRWRGRALGILGGVEAFGIIVGVLSMGLLASSEPWLLGLEKWRWGFFLLGGMSVLSGLLILLLVREPARGAAEPELAAHIDKESASRYRIRPSDLPRILRIPTVWVATLQGVAGTMPWVVLGQFLPLWLVETRGMSADIELGNPNGSAPLAFAFIVIGTIVSNVLGGILGDWADRLSPRYGRTVIGQVSVLFAIPLSWIMLTQTQDWSFGAFLALCFGTAVLISWTGRGSKEPMMQNAVPPELRSSAYAVNDFLERGFAALVSVLAGGLAGSTAAEFTRAMLWTIPVPWLVCFILYSGFYWAYPRDAARLRALLASRARELR
ncbi:MAG: MFS transporter [Chloroflexia bacterium]|nr:MFS transporter [Chloroflexia bacterium]